MIYKIHKREFLEDKANELDAKQVPATKDVPINDKDSSTYMIDIAIKDSLAKVVADYKFKPEQTLGDVYNWAKANCPVVKDNKNIVFNSEIYQGIAPYKNAMNKTDTLQKHIGDISVRFLEFEIVLTDVNGVPYLNAQKQRLTSPEIEAKIKSTKDLKTLQLRMVFFLSGQKPKPSK